MRWLSGQHVGLGVVGLAVVALLAILLVAFTDIDGNPHQTDIEAVRNAGVTQGCNPPDNDRYCPEREVTRGEMAAFLTRALELPPSPGDPFVDDDDSIFEPDIASLAAAGITRGCNPPTNDEYCPHETVERGEMAAFLTRALRLPPADRDPFVDDDGTVFEADIASLAAAGITLGCNPPANDEYCPHDPVQRDQMASFLARGLDLDVPASACQRWVDATGDDDADGSADRPWATIEHALEAAPGSGCVISVMPGRYEGGRVERRFTGETVLRSHVPYTARLHGDTTVLDVQGTANLTIEGFEMSQEPGARGVLLNVEDADGFDSNHITIRDNIIHDAFDDDLLKIRSGARFVTVDGNVFYNQAANEQHIDVNGVQDISITDNLFANDFAASGREDPGDTKAYIVVKDSSATGELGSRRVAVRRNVFMHWRGGRETIVQIGNDGKAYHEAIDVQIDTNLFLGDSADYTTAPLGIAGVKDVRFVNNTIVGDLPSGAFAARFDRKGDNPPNEGIELRNNIYVDPTGTMDDFTNGDEIDVVLDNNMYWNAGSAFDDEGPVDPSDDAHGIVADPLLDYDHSSVLAPLWDGIAFQSGSSTIRREFVRIVERYASLGAGSPAVDRADVAVAPLIDILGRPRGSAPDLGALETGLD